MAEQVLSPDFHPKSWGKAAGDGWAPSGPCCSEPWCPPGAAFWGQGQLHWGHSLRFPSPSSPACPVPAGGPPAPPGTPQDEGCLASSCLWLPARCRRHRGSRGSETCPRVCCSGAARGNGAARSPACPRLLGVSSGTRVARLVPEDSRAPRKCPAPAAPHPRAAPGSCLAPLRHPGAGWDVERDRNPQPPRRISGIPVLPALATRTRPLLVPRGRGPASHAAIGAQNKTGGTETPSRFSSVRNHAAGGRARRGLHRERQVPSRGACRPPAPSMARGRAGATRRPAAGPGAGAAGAAGNAARAQQRVQVGVRGARREAARRWK